MFLSSTAGYMPNKVILSDFKLQLRHLRKQNIFFFLGQNLPWKCLKIKTLRRKITNVLHLGSCLSLLAHKINDLCSALSDQLVLFVPHRCTLLSFLFVQIYKCICPNSNVYLFKLKNIFTGMYLSKLTNIFDQNAFSRNVFMNSSSFR